MMDKIVVYVVADANQYLGVLSNAEARLVAFASLAAAELTKHSFKLAANYESNLVGFTTMAKASSDRFTGVMSNVMGQIQQLDERGATLATAQYSVSAEQAEAMSKNLLDDITQLAVVTPYMTDELITAGRTLAGYGVSVRDVLPTLNAIGEATAGVGGDLEKLQRITLAYGQVVSKNRFYAAELRQFTESGIGAKDFADTMGVSVKQFVSLMEQGKVGSDVMVRGFQRMTAEGGRFHGLMDKLMTTPRGRFSSFYETIQIGLREFGRTATSSMEKSGFWNELNRIMDDLKKFGPGFLQGVSNFFGHSREALLGVEEFGKSIYDMASRTAAEFDKIPFTFQDAVVWAAKIPYEAERFGLKFMLGLVEIGQWWDTKFVPKIRDAAWSFTDSFWDAFASVATKFNEKMEKHGVTMWVPNQADRLGPRQKILDNDAKAVEFWSNKVIHYTNRVAETEKKIAEQGQRLRSAFDKIPGFFGPAKPDIPPLTLPEQLLGSEMVDYVNKVKGAFADTGKGINGTIDRVDELAKKFEALQRAANPVGMAWEDAFRKMDESLKKLEKSSVLGLPGGKAGPIQYNSSVLAQGLAGGMGLAAWDEHAKRNREAFRQMTEVENENWTRKLAADRRKEPNRDLIAADRAIFGGSAGTLINNLLSGKNYPTSLFDRLASGQMNIDKFDAGIPLQFGGADVQAAIDKVNKWIEPFAVALNNTEYMDKEGNIGLKSIREALTRRGIDPKDHPAEFQRMLSSGELSFTGTNLSQKEAEFGAGTLYDSLRKGMSEFTRARETFPRAILKGSQDEADLIARTRNLGQQTLADEVVNLINAQKEYNRLLEIRNKELFDIFDQLRKDKIRLAVFPEAGTK